MEPDLLAGGREPTRSPGVPLRRLLRADGQVVLAALLAVLAGAALSLPGLRSPGDPTPSVRSLPRVVLYQARVEQVRPQPDGVLTARVHLEGLRGLQVLSLRVELPGTVVVLDALPDVLSGDGDAAVGLSLLPRCPEGVQGLGRAAVVAAVRRAGGPVREARVRLDPGAALSAAVRQRCGTVEDPLGTVVALPDTGTAPAAGVARVRVLLAAQGRPVTVVGVAPGPGLATEVRGPLPLALVPGTAAVPLVVELRAKGCGGAPDTPPFLLLLEEGPTVAVSVDGALRPDLDALRPFRCTTP